VNLSDYDALSFDCYGTLIDWEQGLGSILSNVHRAGFAGSARRLDVRFDHILTAEDIGSYKPSARNFETLKKLRAEIGIGEGKLLHVAQSLFHDHLPAKAAGIPTVWINRRYDQPGWGATPEPTAEVSPDWEYPSMAAFAEACYQDQPSQGQPSAVPASGAQPSTESTAIATNTSAR